MSIFTDLFIKPPRRSKKVLDHPYITSTDFGKIIPVLLEDVVPGDVFKCTSAAEIKLFPTLAPLRQGIEVRLDYFFVPNRLIWDDWQTFITGGDDGTEAPVWPYINLSDFSIEGVGSIIDYFGLPCQVERGGDVIDVSDETFISALPFRAYDLIWNEFYRDQNLQEPETISTASGYDTTTVIELLYRGLKKDYFTSALPWTQRGPQVTIPLAGTAPVTGKAVIPPGVSTTDIQGGYFKDDEGPLPFNDDFAYITKRTGETTIADLTASSSRTKFNHIHTITRDEPQELNVTGSADLASGSAISINELRRLNSVQKWLERNARAGSRYVEQILSHFGVRTPDYRLDRPEYIGGGKQIIGMAEILQTSQTASTPQGTRAGVGYGNMMVSSKKYKIDEHGFVIGLLSIVPAQNIYADGIARKWTRTSKFDYYFPEFQNLGEQAIKVKEIYGYDALSNEATFGYTPRYAEYQYHPGVVTGEMRQSMSYWHMARLFSNVPVLNGDFIDSQNGDYDRIFPTDEQLGDRFVVNMMHYERMKRPMQKNPNPSL